MYPQSMFGAKIRTISFFLLKVISFTAFKDRCILYRHVYVHVMVCSLWFSVNNNKFVILWLYLEHIARRRQISFLPVRHTPSKPLH